MMDLLLDTHVLLWAAGAEERLSRRAHHAIVENSGNLWLSPVSLQEILALRVKGRIATSDPVRIWFSEVTARLGLREAAMTHEVALASGEFTLVHKDPADRLLVATARVYGLTLVTADRLLLKSKACPMIRAA